MAVLRYLLSAALFLTAISLKAQVHIDDNFESYTPGSELGSSWETNVNGDASILVTTGAYNSPGQSVQVLQTGDNGTGWFTQYHEPQYGQVTYSAFIRTNNVTNETITLSAREGGWPPGPWIAFGYRSGWISYYDGSSWHDIVPASNNQWYQVKLEVDVFTQSYDIYIDDMVTPKVTGAEFWFNVSSLESIRFEVYQTGGVDPDAGDAAWVDDVYVESPDGINANVGGLWNLTFSGADCAWSGTMTLDQEADTGLVNGSGNIAVAPEDSCSDLTGSIRGIVEGNSVRLVFPEGQPQVTQMEGTVQGTRLSGDWSALGGSLSGTWSAVRPGSPGRPRAIPVLPPFGLVMLALGLILLAARRRSL
jgi:hypothetical protein